MSTEAETARRDAFSSGGIRRFDWLRMDGRSTHVRNWQAVALWWLMRGGIEDVKTLTLATGVQTWILQQLDLDRLFVAVDDRLADYEVPGVQLDANTKAAPVYCCGCGSRLERVPCGCGRVAEYTTTPERSKPVWVESWIDRGDRHWVNRTRIQLSNSAYHGGGGSDGGSDW